MTTQIQRVIEAGVVPVGGESIAGVYLRSFTKATTRRTMAGALDVAAVHLGAGRDDVAWHRISPARYADMRSAIAASYAASTTNKAMVAVRGCVRLAWLDGMMSQEVYARVLDATKAVKVKRNATHGRTISTGTYHDAVAAIDTTTPAGVRDVAMLHLMRGGGLRRDEVAGMTMASYDVELGAVRIVGKGAKPRTVYLPPAARTALDAWVSLRGASGGALFVRINKAGVIASDGMTAQAVYDVVTRRMAAVGASIRPHDLRRTYATNEARRGVPLPVLQRQLGHASLATTSVYMMIEEDEQQRHAAGLVL